MTRLILDTCAVIDLITSSDATELEFWDIIDDPDTMLYASFETARACESTAFLQYHVRKAASFFSVNQ